jgi:L-alanine-DL-glutamate epimerase-like enolase superfamily enzyme
MPSIIKRVSCYRVSVPIKDGTYSMSAGRDLDAFDTTIVRIDTHDGHTGWGEVTPLGATYLPSYPEGARTGIREIAPALIGEDATQLDRINFIMDEHMRGHPYVKTAIDIACWDILGKVAGLPVCTLLGGRFGDDIPLYRSITKGTPEAMVGWIERFRSEGIHTFQLKVGGEPDVDIQRMRHTMASLQPGERIVADANGGWLSGEAARVMRAVQDLDITIEQPCRTYEECLTIRHRTNLPMVLDESIDSLSALMRGLRDGAMDGVNIKISKFGGLTRSRTIRDVCVASNIPMTIEDTACTDITACAVAHLAQSTPPHLRMSVTTANIKTAFRTATEGAVPADGKTRAPDAPGLGMEPIMDVLGAPLFEVQ